MRATRAKPVSRTSLPSLKSLPQYNNDNRQPVSLSYKHATNISTSIKVAASAKGYIYKAIKPIAKDTTLKPKMSV